jgi:hypothetical protein
MWFRKVSTVSAAMLENTPIGRMPFTQRSRVTNRPLSGWRGKGNTAEARRVRDLYLTHLRSLGDPEDVLLQAKCRHAAELQVAVEALRLRAAKGENIDISALVKLCNCADRAVERLNALARHLF